MPVYTTHKQSRRACGDGSEDSNDRELQCHDLDSDDKLWIVTAVREVVVSKPHALAQRGTRDKCCCERQDRRPRCQQSRSQLRALTQLQCLPHVKGCRSPAGTRVPATGRRAITCSRLIPSIIRCSSAHRAVLNHQRRNQRLGLDRAHLGTCAHVPTAVQTNAPTRTHCARDIATRDCLPRSPRPPRTARDDGTRETRVRYNGRWCQRRRIVHRHGAKHGVEPAMECVGTER